VSAGAEELILNVRGGVRISVPANLALITPYVTLEQEDWFEDEIRFVRRCLRPGMRAADVGASFGMYTLAMARAVGAEGRVWSFEPTPLASEHLKRSIALNGLGNVTLRRDAVTETDGDVVLSVYAHTEITEVAVAGAAGETMRVRGVTLDRLAREEIRGDLDFLKVDVEGHELAVLRGAGALLEEASPLVMLEIMVGEHVDLRACRRLREAGYEFYSLLPGALLLAPFDLEALQDAYPLNLFACKTDRARQLEAEGLLALSDAEALGTPAKEHWFQYAEQAPYARPLHEKWLSPKAGVNSYLEGLAAFAHSRASAGAAEKHAWLGHAFRCVAESLQAGDSPARRVSYARLAWELGLRVEATNALGEANRADFAAAAFGGEAFLSPSPRYSPRRCAWRTRSTSRRLP
jgi:FkbM family methyltransferase